VYPCEKDSSIAVQAAADRKPRLIQNPRFADGYPRCVVNSPLGLVVFLALWILPTGLLASIGLSRRFDERLLIAAGVWLIVGYAVAALVADAVV